MKKLLQLIITITTALFIFGCADKVAFKEQLPLKNSALVYVYAKQIIVDGDDLSIGKFKLMVDDKLIDVVLVENEYTPINLKAQKIEISATKDSLITKKVTINLLPGDVYYLRATLAEGGDFNFEKVSASIGLKEIKKTKLHGSSVEEKNDAVVLIDERTEEVVLKKSKIEQIKDANQLKIDGILTQKEFDKLKKEILDAN